MVMADPAPSTDLTVNLYVVETNIGTNGHFDDGGKGPRSVTINAGTTSATYTVKSVDDSVDEEQTILFAVLSPGDGYSRDRLNSTAYLKTRDNDPTQVTLSGTPTSVTEGRTKTLALSVGRHLVHGEALPIPLTFGGSAVRGTDYTIACSSRWTATAVSCNDLNTASTPTVTFSRNARSVDLTLTAISDSASEPGGETVDIGLGVLDSNTGTGLHGGASGTDLAEQFTIRDFADPSVPVLSLSIPNGETSIAEGGTGVTVRVTSNQAIANGSLRFALVITTSSGYRIDRGNVVIGTIADGATTADFSFAVEDNDDDTANGTVTFAILDTEEYSLGAIHSHTLAVIDNDTPTVSFASASQSAGEGSGTHNVKVKLSPAPASDITLAYTVDGTATAGSDFTIADSGTLPVPKGATAATIPVTIIDDSVEDNGETVVLTLTAGTDYQVGAIDTHTLTIQNHEPAAPTVTVAREVGTASSITEGGDAVFTVTANPAPASPLAVTVTVAADGDYGITAGERTVTLSTSGSATLTLATTNDDADEPDGSVAATVAAGDGYTVGDPASGTVAIADDDPTPVTTDVDPALVAQVRGYAAETHHGQAHVDRWRRVLVAFGVETYPGLAPTTAAEAEANAQRYSSPLWPRIAEVLAALEAAPGPDPATVPAITVSAGAAVTEGGDATFTLTATPAPAADLAVSVGVITDGAYGITAGRQTVTVPAAGSATLTLATVNDDADEPDGSVTVTVEAGDGYTVGDPASGSVAIADDDDAPAPAVTIAAKAASVTEGGDTVFTLTANPAPASALAVSVTVAAEGAYGITAGRQTVTLPTAGSATLTLATTGDDADEPDGSVSVTVAAGNGYTVGDPASGTVAIADDDLPLPAIAVSAGDAVTEGGDATFTVTASPAPASPLAVSVTVATEGDYGIASGTQTVSIPTTGGAVLTLATANDDADEPDGSVSVTVAAGDRYTVGSPASGSVSIADDDLPPPAVSITAKAASVTEGGAAAFALTADRAPDADLTVTLSVAETGGGDHVAAADEGPATAVIAKGATEAIFSVATVDDDVDEPDGSVTVTLKDGGGYTVSPSPGDAAAVTVSDNDAAALPSLSVADVTVKEGAWMEFTVRLSAPSAGGVSVKVSTRDSSPVSARPKEDYWPLWSELVSFRPGETEKTVWVYIYNDSHDEDPETFELVLSEADGATVGDGVAVGTIVNDDPMPAAWLARFGRTVAEQALDGIAGRMAADRTPGIQGAIAGQALSFDPAANDSAAPAHAPDGAVVPGGTGALALADVAQAFGGQSGHSGPGGLGHDAAGFANGTQSRTMTARDALLGSSFSLTGAADGSGGSMGFWGRAAQGSFDGSEGTFSLDGTVTTGMLGADYARGKWLVGLALAQSTGEGDYRDTDVSPRPDGQSCPDGVDSGLCSGAVRTGDGSVEASLTAAIPYAALQASERLKLWGAAGYGTGEVTLKTALGGSYKADTSWSMAAAGLRGDLLAPPAPGSGSGAGSGSGPALAVTSDALWTRTSSEKTNQLAASDSDATRLRLGLEGSYRMALEDGGHLTPKLEIGARHDGGDAETGFGVELGGGIVWTDQALGLSLDVSGRTLIEHGNDDMKDRGYAAALAFDPDPATQRGPSLSLRQEFGGRAAGGLDALFAPDPLEDRTGSAAATSRWAMEAAYGFPAFGGRFTGSPHVGLGFSAAARDYSLGWRWTPAERAPDLAFGLKTTRLESDAAEPEHTLGVEIRATW